MRRSYYTTYSACKTWLTRFTFPKFDNFKWQNSLLSHMSINLNSTSWECFFINWPLLRYSFQPSFWAVYLLSIIYIKEDLKPFWRVFEKTTRPISHFLVSFEPHSPSSGYRLKKIVKFLVLHRFRPHFKKSGFGPYCS